jgi:DHA2 family multidrug resistance protein
VWLLITCTLVTTLYATSLTIANVSLPQIQGALSASPDQVAWVVTSNLIATAVTIPLAGWISSRFGRRRAMLWGITGFGIATVMCGFATSLGELVFWRVLQSACGSPLTPISQSVVIDEFTGTRRGPALSIYSMGVGIPPTIAPLFGGYISEAISWRWVFFILIPLALIAFVGVLTAIRPDPPRDQRSKLDWIGFLSLSITVACIQLVLDRGERAGWFGAIEIIVGCALAVLFGWIFLAHSLTRDRPFLDPRLLLERKFALGIGISAIFGMLFVTPIVMLPAMLQQLRDLPEFTVGLLIASRGAGTMLASLIMILFANSWDPRLLFLIGFGLHTYAGL